MLIRFAIFTLNFFCTFVVLAKTYSRKRFLCFSLLFATPFIADSISDILLLLSQALKPTKTVLIKTQAGAEIFPKDRGSSRIGIAQIKGLNIPFFNNHVSYSLCGVTAVSSTNEGTTIASTPALIHRFG